MVKRPVKLYFLLICCTFHERKNNLGDWLTLDITPPLNPPTRPQKNKEFFFARRLMNLD